MSSIPDGGWLTIRDKDFADLYPSESSSPEEMRAAWSELLKRAGGMYVCPKCGRVMWSQPGRDCYYKFRSFRPEELVGAPLSNGLTEAQWAAVDALIFEQRILDAINVIRQCAKVDLCRAVQIHADRYQLLRDRSPDRFTCSHEDYWRDFYS